MRGRRRRGRRRAQRRQSLRGPGPRSADFGCGWPILTRNVLKYDLKYDVLKMTSGMEQSAA